MKIFVHYEHVCQKKYRNSGSQGDWREDWDFSVQDVSTIPSNKYSNEEFDINADIKRGDQVHVLSVVYSSGDSFGYADGKGEVLWVFKDVNLAQEALKRWQYACDVHSNNWRHENKQQFASFFVDGDRQRKMSNPVYGYHEHLSSLDLRTMILQ